MDTKPTLHILFTMDCDRVADKYNPRGPRSWELSSRTIEGFCSRLLERGYAATLFLAAECTEQQTPLLDELLDRGVELGLRVAPQSLSEGRFNRPLGFYSAEQQRELVSYALQRFENALGLQPRSFRSAECSTNNDTFKTIYELGFRQGSLSSPGQNVPRTASVWVGALPDAHYVDPANRLVAGVLPFLELPLTSDPTQMLRNGLPYEMRIESGAFDDWQRPIAQRQIARMASEGVAFRSLCISAINALAFSGMGELSRPPPPLPRRSIRPVRLPLPTTSDPHTATLDALLDYCDSLAEQYEIIPVTLSAAHERFRRLSATSR